MTTSRRSLSQDGLQPADLVGPAMPASHHLGTYRALSARTVDVPYKRLRHSTA
jgi:hypothetical protein